MPTTPQSSAPSAASRLTRRGFLAASALAVPVAWAAGTGDAASASGLAARRTPVGPSGAGLAWYDITNQTVAAANFAEPVTQSRTWAVSWLAAARALGRSGDPDYAAAALAQALHDTLAAQVPSQQAQLDASLAAALSSVPGGQARRRGIAAGASDARATLAERAGDGLDTGSVDIPFTPPPAAPGVFQLTPPLARPVVRAGQSSARPFLLERNDQFDPGPPPGLDSGKYADALAEVKAIGAPASLRTAEQTDVANFWYPALNFAYVQVLRAILAGSGRPLAWQAKLVAAFHAVTTDAQISIYNAKFKYLRWRPYTAITVGPLDADPAWTSFRPAPQHPEYPSGHAGYAGASQGVLEAFLGPRAPAAIPLTSPDDPGVTRTYADWKTLTDEVINARVWEGVHFRFSDITGARQGLRLSRWELHHLERILKPR